MLMGWWQVKLSSGCPLARGHGLVAVARLAGTIVEVTVRTLLRNGTGAVLVVLIMFIGSLGLWVGTPLLWLWVGSQIQGATESLGAALGGDVRRRRGHDHAAGLGAGQAERRLPRQLRGPRPQ